jgi:hypothetical protein
VYLFERKKLLLTSEKFIALKRHISSILSAESAMQQSPGWSEAEPWDEPSKALSSERHARQAKTHA